MLQGFIAKTQVRLKQGYGQHSFKDSTLKPGMNSMVSTRGVVYCCSSSGGAMAEEGGEGRGGGGGNT